MAEKQQMQQLKEVDINDVGLLEGETEELNPAVDAYEYAPPLPDGRYRVKVSFGKQQFLQGTDKNGSVYYVANLELRVKNNEKYDGTVLFGKASSYVAAGKENSQMGTLLTKMGVAVPSSITHRELARLLAAAIRKEPELYVDTQWKAWDMENGEWIKQGMANFPKDADGQPIPQVKSKDGEVYPAKAKIVKWFGLKEMKPQQQAQQAPQKPSPKKKREEDFEGMIEDMD